MCHQIMTQLMILFQIEIRAVFVCLSEVAGGIFYTFLIAARHTSVAIF